MAAFSSTGVSLSCDGSLARIYGGAVARRGPTATHNIRKILLINPPEASPLETYVKPTRYPVNLFTVAAALTKQIPNLQIVVADLALQGKSIEQILQDEKPDLVALTSTTPQYDDAKVIAKKAKETLGTNTPVVLGGVHATALPDFVLRDCSEIDYLVLGESEITFAELILALDDSANTLSNLKKVKAIAYRDVESAAVITTGFRQRLSSTDLDEYPLPTDVLPPGYLEQYAKLRGYGPAREKEGPLGPTIDERGCFRACSFCGSNVVFPKGRGVKNPMFRSADATVRQIQALHYEHGVNTFIPMDDIFDYDPGRTLYILGRLRGLSLEFHIWSALRKIRNSTPAERVQYYRRLRELGVTEITFGVESGDPKILKDMGKGGTLELAEESTKVARDEIGRVKWFLLVGYPGQDQSSIEMSAQLMRIARPTISGVAVAQPYPGTRLYDRAKIGFIGKEVSEATLEYTGTDWRMMHEPPPQLKTQRFIPQTKTDVMTAEQIADARDHLLRVQKEVSSGTHG